MKSRWRWIAALAGLVPGAMIAAAWRAYIRRPRGRLPGHEGLDDPAISQAYDRVSRMPQMSLIRRYVTRRATDLATHGHAVDLGSGPGLLAVELARRAPDLKVTGIDLSPVMLSRAEAYGRQAGLGTRLEFKQGNARAIPFPDQSLDLVVSTLSLHHWSDPGVVLDEIARVLDPGGAFFIFDLRRDMSPPAWMLLWFATHFVVPSPLRRANEPLASRDAAYTPDEVTMVCGQSALQGWCVEHGPLWLAIVGRQERAR